MEREEDYRIFIRGWRMRIQELNIYLHEGAFCNYVGDGKQYIPDLSLTVIMEDDTKKEEGECLYYEQDGLEIALANYIVVIYELYDEILALYGEMEHSGKTEVIRDAVDSAESEFGVQSHLLTGEVAISEVLSVSTLSIAL